MSDVEQLQEDVDRARESLATSLASLREATRRAALGLVVGTVLLFLVQRRRQRRR